MPDRIIRDEIWLSERFLDLPTDAARLAFIRFVSICDDFGNFEGGARRLYRLLHGCTQIKTESAASETIDALMACDLVRRYEVETREFFHIPRFRSHRQYLSRAYPCSPWCDPSEILGKTKRNIINKGLAKEIVTTRLQRSSVVAEGVGVGVGESNPLAQADAFACFWSAYPKRKSKGQAEKAWKAHAHGNIEAIMAGLERAKRSDEWTKSDGRFIPYPATWLNAKGWLDEAAPVESRMGKFVI